MDLYSNRGEMSKGLFSNSGKSICKSLKAIMARRLRSTTAMGDIQRPEDRGGEAGMQK
jgi:hypothetical protein